MSFLFINSIILLVIILLMEYHRTQELVTPWNLYIGFTIIDILGPGVLFLYTGLPERVWFMKPFLRGSWLLE